MPSQMISEKITHDLADRQNPTRESWVHFNRMYSLLLDIASRSINVPLDSIQGAINKALGDIGRFVNADRAYIFKYDFINNVALNTHEWCNKGIAPQIGNLQETPLEPFVEWVGSHKNNCLIRIPDVSALPAGDLKALLEPQQIKSLLSVPVFDHETLQGFIGFDSVQKSHQYTESEIELICFFSQIFVNLMKREINETALYKNRVKYQNIIENSLDVIMLTKPDGTIAYLSPACEQVLEHDPGTLIGRKVWIAHEMDRDKVNQVLKKVFQGEAGYSFEYRILTQDGRTKWVSHSWSCLFSNHKLDLVVSNIRDISRLKQAEKEKLEAQKFAAEQKKQALVGQIAGKMAHDFNNVLGAIMGNAQLGLLKCENDAIRQKLHLIFEQTVKGKNLTKNLVAFARDQEPKQEYFQMRDKLDLVLNLLEKDLEGIQMSVDVGRDMPDLLADPGMIEHALVNLIQNAVHAVSLTRHPVIMVKAYRRHRRIFCEVIDNGCGIARHHLESIFDPSFTLKGSRDNDGAYEAGIKGTGYGMANVQKYVMQHKGDIEVESQLGTGTKVVLQFPVIDKKLTPDEKRELTFSQIQSNKSILLVEDEPAIAMIQKHILTAEPCHHQVDIAVNGKEAMALWDSRDYDFVSLDYMLPGKTNGMDVYRYIRKSDQEIPVLFISGNIEFLESIEELKQQDPLVGHISKPCQNDDYVRAVDHLITAAS